MSYRSAFAAAAWAACIALAAPRADAGDGHDHGDTAPAAGTVALPRFAAVSETFELVGVVDGRRVTLYLDRWADGSPVEDATLELELGGVKVPVHAHQEGEGKGEFEAELAQALEPGVIAVAATVIAGKDTDLLAGELDLHAEDAEHAEHAERADAAAPHYGTWKDYAAPAAWAILGALVLAALGHRLRRMRRARAGGGA
jgi:hypothetical protein